MVYFFVQTLTCSILFNRLSNKKDGIKKCSQNDCKAEIMTN